MNLDKPEVIKFIKFSKQQRKKTILELTQTLAQSISINQQSTYTQYEVDNILSSLTDAITDTITTELIYHSHSTVLLISQYCNQANLKSDISQLENLDLLNKVMEFEQQLAFKIDVKEPVLVNTVIEKSDDMALNAKIKDLEEQLEKKVHETRIFQNFMKILEEKNAIIDQLRSESGKNGALMTKERIVLKMY